MSSARPIGVFDSGIGGLTVVHELIHQLPHESIVYFGDTARVPYGPKSPDTVRRYSREIASFLMNATPAGMRFCKALPTKAPTPRGFTKTTLTPRDAQNTLTFDSGRDRLVLSTIH